MSEHRPRRRWYPPWRLVCACGRRQWPCPTAEPLPATPLEDNPWFNPNQAVNPRVNRRDWGRQNGRSWPSNAAKEPDTPAYGSNVGAWA